MAGPALRWIAVAALAVVGTTAAGASTERAARQAGGEIAFSSTRGSGSTGDVYLLRVGQAPRRLSSPVWPEFGLAVAPRGRRLAYWRSDGTRARLILQDAGSGATRTTGVVEPSGQDPGFPVAFSPDGRRLLTSRWVDGGKPSAHVDVWLVDAPSGAARRLGRCGVGAAWSPNGRLVSCHSPRRATLLDMAGRARLSVAADAAPLWSRRGLLAIARGRGTVVLTSAGRVVARRSGTPRAWLPDGRLLVVEQGARLLVVDARRPARPRLVVPQAYPGAWLAVAPDGRGLAVELAGGVVRFFPLDRGRPITLPGRGVWSAAGRFAFIARPLTSLSYEVRVGDRFGRHSRLAGRFLDDRRGASELRWLPDSSALLLEWRARPGADVWAVRPDGSGLRRVIAGPRDDGGPAWSPRGDRLAYVTSEYVGRHGLGGPSTAIWTADGAGSGRVAVTRDPAFDVLDHHPSWSPVADRLAYAHSTPDRRWIAVIGADGSADRKLVDDAGRPAWSPDGRTIAFVRGGEIRGVAPDGGPDRLLAAAPSPDDPPVDIAWSPDGRELVYSTRDGVWIAPVSGAGARLVVRIEGASAVMFSPDGTQLAFSALHRGPGIRNSDVYVAGVDGSSLHAVASSPADEGGPTWRALP